VRKEGIIDLYKPFTSWRVESINGELRRGFV